MKLAVATIALASAAEKKVPPRHPLNRLNKLDIFFANFADDVVASRTSQGVADRFADRMESMIDNFQAAFERANCGYYDEDSTHGGPDPNPDVRPNGKPRNRRDADNEVEPDFEDYAAYCAENAGSFNEEQQSFCCGLHQDGHTSVDYCPPGIARSGNKKNAYDRLANDPSLKWRQICTGTRKWVQRYINNCGGQRKNNLGVRRVRRLYNTWNERLGL